MHASGDLNELKRFIKQENPVAHAAFIPYHNAAGGPIACSGAEFRFFPIQVISGHFISTLDTGAEKRMLPDRSTGNNQSVALSGVRGKFERKRGIRMPLGDDP